MTFVPLRIVEPYSETAKAILVGEAPPRDWDGIPDTILADRGCERMARAVMFRGYPDPWMEYLESFVRCNIVQEPTKQKWPIKEARDGAVQVMVLAQQRNLPIVLLGRRTADAFRLFETEIPGVWEHGILLPFPSGKSPFWHSASEQIRAAEVFAAFWGRLM